MALLRIGLIGVILAGIYMFVSDNPQLDNENQQDSPQKNVPVDSTKKKEERKEMVPLNDE